MEIILTIKEQLQLIKALIRTSSKNQEPYIKLEAKNGSIDATVVNTETQFSCSLDGTIIADGICCLPASDFYGIVAGAIDVKIKSKENSKVELITTEGKYKLNTIPSSNITIRDVSEIEKLAVNRISVPGSYLKTLLDICNVSSNDAKPHYHMISVYSNDGYLCAAGADTTRLVFVKTNHSANLDTPISIVKKYAPDIVSFLSPEDNYLLIQTPNNTIVKNDRLIFLCGNLSGTFPKLDSLIKNYTYSVSLSGTELASKIARVQRFSDKKAGVVKFSFQDAELTVSSSNDKGEASELMCIDYTASPFETLFSCNQLLYFIAKADKLSLQFDEDRRRFCIRNRNVDYESTYILTPVRME